MYIAYHIPWNTVIYNILIYITIVVDLTFFYAIAPIVLYKCFVLQNNNKCNKCNKCDKFNKCNKGFYFYSLVLHVYSVTGLQCYKG